MSNAPEKIWAQDAEPSECNFTGGGWWDDTIGNTQYPHMVEYTRSDTSAATIAKLEAEKIAIAQKFDELHPDPALMARIIMTSIERECLNEEQAETIAKLEAQLAEAVGAVASITAQTAEGVTDDTQ